MLVFFFSFIIHTPSPLISSVQVSGALDCAGMLIGDAHDKNYDVNNIL